MRDFRYASLIATTKLMQWLLSIFLYKFSIDGLLDICPCSRLLGWVYLFLSKLLYPSQLKASHGLQSSDRRDL